MHRFDQSLAESPRVGSAALENEEITKEEYDQWRYKYPEFDTTRKWVKVPSLELSDALIKEQK